MATSARFILPVTLSVLALAFVGCSDRAPARRPNRVLYAVDTLRADALKSTGDPRAFAPHLDALAREAMV